MLGFIESLKCFELTEVQSEAYFYLIFNFYTYILITVGNEKLEVDKIRNKFEKHNFCDGKFEVKMNSCKDKTIYKWNFVLKVYHFMLKYSSNWKSYSEILPNFS